jgi:type II secretory pathway component PulK
MNKSTKKNNKGAALIIVLFTLVIVSVFMSLMYSVSRKQILSETKERQASLYSQYLRTTLDLLVSPLIMGNCNNTILLMEIFQLMRNGQPVDSSS